MSIQRTFIHPRLIVLISLQSTYNYIFFNRDTHSIIDINNPSTVKFFRMDNFKEAIDILLGKLILFEKLILDPHLEAFNQSITDHSILEPNYEEEAKIFVLKLLKEI